MKSVSFSPQEKEGKPKATREQALKVARLLGCRGVHEGHDGSWMPCASMDQFRAAQKGKSALFEFDATENFEAKSLIASRFEKQSSKSAEYYSSREDAMRASRMNGCSGVRTVVLGGKKYFAPCVATDRFEKLGERGVVGISTMDGGGLTSAPVGGKDLQVETAAKFVNFASRSTDPDVFSDPDSARVRARNLGCIGIRRYTARDGKTVWMPCTNNSDYRRLMNIRGDGMRRRSRKNVLAESLPEVKRAFRPKKKLPTISSDDMNMLASMVRRHNVDVDEPIFRTNLRDVRLVFLRGLAGGSEDDAVKRVSVFLRAMASKKPLDRNDRDDFDLVPANHPSKDVPSVRKKTDLVFSEGQIGVVQKHGCCPEIVKRYHVIR